MPSLKDGNLIIIEQNLPQPQPPDRSSIHSVLVIRFLLDFFVFALCLNFFFDLIFIVVLLIVVAVVIISIVTCGIRIHRWVHAER